MNYCERVALVDTKATRFVFALAIGGISMARASLLVSSMVGPLAPCEVYLEKRLYLYQA